MIKIKKNNLWWFIPLTVFAIIFFIGFILTSISSFDYDWSVWFGKGMQNEVVKFIVVFYDQVGEEQVWLVVFICLFIILETIHYYKKQKTDSLTKRHSWWIYLVYGLLLSIFIAFKMTRVLSAKNMDTGFGPGIDAEYLTSNTYKLVSRIIIVTQELLILTLSIIYLRTKFSKRQDVLSNEYWVSSVKALVFFILPYVALWFIKQSFGRPFLVNSDYSTIIGQVELVDGKAVGITLTEEMLKIPGIEDNIQYILDSYNNNQWTQAEYFQWYEVNGNWFDNLKYWLPWRMFNGVDMTNAPKAWADGDFPSGHTLSTFSLIGIGYVFVGKNRPKKLPIYIKVIFVVWFMHLLIMMTTLVIARSHWLSDVFFSYVFDFLMLFASSFLVERYIRVLICKFNNRFKNEKNRVKYVFKDDKINMFVSHYGFEWKIKSIRMSKNNPDKDIAKINKTTNRYKADSETIKYVFSDTKYKNIYM
ncbi:phosphatase PAP2 family protein [[Acholeplasma] multilocale]|uniref:phosphatase PAP2 family protein n=1 Tax=[Acholeplasma] multilocale TaxID=264638 RepID=UPI00047873F3|nr:phosphatase PAP2 family protein [[Acholeplasma] multilocale]